MTSYFAYLTTWVLNSPTAKNNLDGAIRLAYSCSELPGFALEEPSQHASKDSWNSYHRLLKPGAEVNDLRQLPCQTARSADGRSSLSISARNQRRTTLNRWRRGFLKETIFPLMTTCGHSYPT